MKLLVTGGAGFIGSNFLYYMKRLHPDWSLCCADLLTYAGNLKSIAPLLDGGLRFYRADIADENAMKSVFEAERPDAVVNFAAETHVDRSILDPALFLRTNVLGTGVLLSLCREFGVQRFHQVSTDEVYGDLPLDRPELFFTEQSPLRASSPYSASKAGADLLALSFHRTYGLPVTVSRCSNNYGPYQFPEKLIPLMIANILGDKPLPVYGDGKNVRDWLFVEDHCAAIDCILEKGSAGRVYNVGGNNEQSNIAIVRTLLSLLGKDESLITYVADRPGHDRRYAIDASLLRGELGWEPKTGFAEGMRSTVDWYLAHRDWWEDILRGEYQDYYETMYGQREVLS